jgi:hypothetical protein
VLQATAEAPNVHRIELNEKGRVTEEFWQSKNKEAFYLMTKDNVLLGELRSDGRRRFNYFDLWRQEPQSLPNARKTGKIADARGSDFPVTYGTNFVNDLLKDPDTSLKGSKRIDTPDGPRTRYEITFTNYATVLKKRVKIGVQSGFVEAEVDSGKIRKIVSLDGKMITNIDYPETIPDEVFAPRSHLVKGLEVHDLTAENKSITHQLATGIAAHDGIVLRLVLLDEDGDLWAIWTGAPVDGKLSHPFRVLGIRTGQGFGPRGFTSNWKNDPRSKASPVTGGRLNGMARPVLEKMADHVSIEIYRDGRYVPFRDIPVMRIAAISDFEKTLGLNRF